jgi:hypothetical protein
MRAPPQGVGGHRRDDRTGSVADPVLFVGLLLLAGRGEKGQRQAHGSILIAWRSISISSPAKSTGLAL